ncbi:hypothetical protein G4B88_000663 [Cannabis sativa]|uniref:NADH-ubiquinone oxidoreductase chain 4 n=1 Tax=Cannabis sativa TaxID=3483 RepID=A0A7J6HFS8_CANSA|nr:hypothetical protein G4B88_000663 [Cannabis sativa]
MGTLPFSCWGRTSSCCPTHGCFFPHPPIAHRSLLLRWALPIAGVDAGFYKRMRSSQQKNITTVLCPPEFVFCRHWPAAKETQPPLGKRGGGVQQALAIEGIGGSILPMLSHKLVPSALFLCVGVLYDRHKTRLVRYYEGSVSTMPNLPTFSFSSTLANMCSPGTSIFIEKFPISIGVFQRNSLVATLAALGMILGAAYSLWLYNPVGRPSVELPEKRVNKCDHDIVGACAGTDATLLS